jgi:hypothetical protein
VLGNAWIARDFMIPALEDPLANMVALDKLYNR